MVHLFSRRVDEMSCLLPHSCHRFSCIQIFTVLKGNSLMQSGQMATWPLNSLASDISSVTLIFTDVSQDLPLPNCQPVSHLVPIPSTNDSNPWLAPHKNVSHPSHRENKVVIGKDSATMDNSKNKLKKQTKKLGEEKEKAKDDAVVEIVMDNVVTFPNSEIEAQEMGLNQKGKGKSKGVKPFEQQELVACAFTGNNVVQVYFITYIYYPCTDFFAQAFEDVKLCCTVDTTIHG
jgi:hypothetical protein